MKTTLLLLSLVGLLASIVCSASSKIGNSYVLENGSVYRVINLESGGIFTSEYKLTESSFNFVRKGSPEFSFTIDGQDFSGASNWEILSVDEVDDEHEGRGLCFTLRSKLQPALELEIIYLTYPDLPVVRKRLVFTNRSEAALKLENLNVETLDIDLNFVDTQVLHNYARQRHLAQRYEGDAYDPLMIVHQLTQSKHGGNLNRGLIVGNEAPGVTKRSTAFFEGRHRITAGLRQADDTFPTRAWLERDKPWASPWVFTCPFEDVLNPMDIVETQISDFVRKHMGIRLSALEEKPVFVYNTWEPFQHDINEEMILELVDAAAEAGMEEFVIDDGWQSNYGDWGIHKEKFPNGLKPVFDYIKSKGMKPGLWISLAAAQTSSEVYQNHPEWLVRKANGEPINLHGDSDKMYDWSTMSMCMSSGWFDYIKGVILELVNEHGLEYLKGDFAVVTGAYSINKARSGCYAEDHEHHADREESFLNNYRRLWQLFDELHEEAPDLFIDCTFETMGAFQLIDYDMCKHAEGNWLSNFIERAPVGTQRVRQMAWWRSPVIPAAAMVVGNQAMDGPNIMYSLKSLTGTLPILLGDPRALSEEMLGEFRSMGDWLRRMQDEHDFMMFRQDLQGFGEPAFGRWDGFQRINTETRSGGIVGVFRNGAVEESRHVVVRYLDPKSKYQVLRQNSGELVCEMTGRSLACEGFPVAIADEFAGELFEVRLVP